MYTKYRVSRHTVYKQLFQSMHRIAATAAIKAHGVCPFFFRKAANANHNLFGLSVGSVVVFVVFFFFFFFFFGVRKSSHTIKNKRALTALIFEHGVRKLRTIPRNNQKFKLTIRSRPAAAAEEIGQLRSPSVNLGPRPSQPQR